MINTIKITFKKARFLIFVAAIVALSSKAFAMGLKENAVVNGNVITLGDIFYDLPHNEKKVLGPAPRPGSNMVLNARTLMRIAVALDLPWRPTDSGERVVLRRAATLISAQEIREALNHEIASQGYGHNIELDLPAQTSEIILPEDQPATFDVTALSIDKSRNWFEATLNAPSAENPIHTSRVSGKIYRMVDVPILRETLRNGTIISKYDLDTVKMRERELNPKMLINAQSLIGMTPRRVAFAGRPIMDNEIEAPQIVHRGDNVTIVLKELGMTLTASGRSLENGAKGDIVRVVNASSNRTVQGVVTGEKEITMDNY